MVVWCPCVTYGQISGRIGSNGCCDVGCAPSCVVFALSALFGCACCAVCFLRQKVAHTVGIKPNGCEDCILSFCCGSCVLCQMANQLEIQKDKCDFGSPPRLETMQR
ncbi:TPA: hypothetical protein N0F65_000375 [Lagenidium giganteum]|uniref:Uncharacterized protein n=1 Tax=Lagenidium giganteum TaxID=4803 RepID=A0AAV2Z223_9STRA|nr:TPA: hypothetical protein N0F65_000375 [Lagenidium giganteum]